MKTALTCELTVRMRFAADGAASCRLDFACDPPIVVETHAATATGAVAHAAGELQQRLSDRGDEATLEDLFAAIEQAIARGLVRAQVAARRAS